MADRPTIAIEIDGETKEVPLPDGVLLETDVRGNWVPKATVESERKKLEKELRGRLSAELLDNEDFIERLVDLKGDTLKERLGVKPAKPAEPDPKALEKLLEKELNPIKQQLEESKLEVERWRERATDAEIREAFDEAGVVNDAFTRQAIASWARGRMKYDPEHGVNVVLGEDGEPEIVFGEDRKPQPKRFVHLLKELKQSGEAPNWFQSETRSGTGFKGNGGGKATPKLKDMTDADKQAFIREHGHAAFLKLIQEARAKAGTGA